MEQEIIIATNNKDKVQEIKEILKDISNSKFISLQEAGIDFDVEETKDTFEGNALKKAIEIAMMANKPCIADDSGLCIEALEGNPGVKTKRFLGENATDNDRNEYYLEKLQGLPKEKRRAKVITAIAFVRPYGEASTFVGIMEGTIATSQRGTNGFAFDTVVETKEGKTLAELSAEEKNCVSSRRKALEKLRDYMKK